MNMIKKCFISHHLSSERSKWICLLKTFADECNKSLIYLLLQFIKKRHMNTFVEHSMFY